MGEHSLGRQRDQGDLEAGWDGGGVGDGEGGRPVMKSSFCAALFREDEGQIATAKRFPWRIFLSDRKRKIYRFTKAMLDMH